MKNKPIFTGSEWSFDKIKKIREACRVIMEEELCFSYFPIQIEIISSEQMMDACAHAGLPVQYSHWSFGKQFVQMSRQYRVGAMQLAYELVINSDPCIVYCMERNTMTMQTIVIAHAGFGHNAFFKNNHLFKQWTQPDAIVDYMVFAREYIAECEEKYGWREVEKVLDACHSLQNYGIDRYDHPVELSATEEEKRQKERIIEQEKYVSELWGTLLKSDLSEDDEDEKEKRFPKKPQENILYFIEKNSPELPVWKREIIRIIRKIAQYFYPQVQTKVLNEGFSTFVHYYIMNRLAEKGLITDGAMQEFLISHTNITKQTDFDEVVEIKNKDPKIGKPDVKRINIFRGINPYALGFKMFMDIKRMCEDPTDEDKEWFPDVAGSDWKETIHRVVTDFRDESAIRQFLSPKVIRDFKFFSLLDDENENHVIVTAIHREDGYRKVRKALADQYDSGLLTPVIEVFNVDKRGDRTLTLRHTMINGQQLHEEDTELVLKNVSYLWEFPVKLESVDDDGNIFESFDTRDEDDEED